ncbi:MAG TPA: contractile injection system tape measure protein [Bacteroidales bacterium]
MTNASKHTIGRLQIEIQAGSKKKAVALQEEISNISRNQLPEILETTFNQFDKKGSSYVIDKLVIDMGKIGYDDFKLKFPADFKKALNQKLKPLQMNTPDLVLDENTIVKEETDFHIAKSYLLTGHLPWYSDSSQINLRQISKKLIRKKSIEFVNLIRLHCTDRNFQNRLENVIPESFYKEFFSLFTQRNIWKDDAVFKQYLLLYRQFPFATATIKAFRILLFKSIIEVLPTDFSSESLQLETLVFSKLADKLSINTTQLVKKSSHSLKKLQAKQGSNELTTQLSLLFHQLEGRFKHEDKKADKQDEVQVIQPDKEEENNSYLIFNAGLILVNPFLNELFKKLNLIENGEFINEQVQMKAVHLLQYAVTGKTGSPEHILLLNKILCGVQVNLAVPWFVKLNMKEKAETTRMITATIKNWSALKNTSAGAFRTAYMQRNGILIKTKNGWKLQVERTAYDVLLSRIPWQYEQVKLSWMKQKIETVW